MDQRHLSTQLSIYNELRDRLSTIYSLDQDDEAIIDTASGETDLNEAIASVLREAEETGAMVEALYGLIKRQRARMERMEAKEQRLRDLAAWAMQESGQKRLPLPDMTVTLRAGKPKLTIEENSLAAQFLKQVIETKPDRAAIQAEIDAGRVPYGVSLDNGAPILTIRGR